MCFVSFCGKLLVAAAKLPIRRCAHKRSTGCGSQQLLRALSGTRISLAAAPASPPCFRRRRRSAPLQLLLTRLSVFKKKNDRIG